MTKHVRPLAHRHADVIPTLCHVQPRRHTSQHYQHSLDQTRYAHATDLANFLYPFLATRLRRDECDAVAGVAKEAQFENPPTEEARRHNKAVSACVLPRPVISLHTS